MRDSAFMLSCLHVQHAGPMAVFRCGTNVAWIYILAELLAALLACSIFAFVSGWGPLNPYYSYGRLQISWREAIIMWGTGAWRGGGLAVHWQHATPQQAWCARMRCHAGLTTPPPPAPRAPCCCSQASRPSACSMTRMTTSPTLCKTPKGTAPSTRTPTVATSRCSSRRMHGMAVPCTH